MVTIRQTPASLIRNIIDGKRTRAAMRGLVKMRGNAVEPILEAVTGAHGRLDRQNDFQSVRHLSDVLVEIAKKDARPLAAALAHHVPGMNMVAWALGHSTSRLARKALSDLAEGNDPGVTAVAEFHANARKRPRRRPGTRKKA